ncbi:STAS domain-containing protein [Planctomycetales bacterium ZRK34]|nr:STAS domain-containing protein [Planctomycetales bacterium ZRK34]
MKLSHEQFDQITVVRLAGELTADDTEPLRRVVNDRLADQTRDFVIDLAETDFVDSRGIETLLWAQEQAGERLGQVRLLNLDDNLRTILRVTRLTNTFETHDSLDSALASLR